MKIKQGADKSFKFYVYRKGSTTPVLEEPQALVFTAVKEKCCGTVILKKSLDDGITFDSETGKYTLTFSPADTINLPVGNYPFDIKIKRANTQYFIVAEGNLAIQKSYTGVI